MALKMQYFLDTMQLTIPTVYAITIKSWDHIWLVRMNISA
jgi:hypothetical protein